MDADGPSRLHSAAKDIVSPPHKRPSNLHRRPTIAGRTVSKRSAEWPEETNNKEIAEFSRVRKLEKHLAALNPVGHLDILIGGNRDRRTSHSGQKLPKKPGSESSKKKDEPEFSRAQKLEKRLAALDHLRYLDVSAPESERTPQPSSTLKAVTPDSQSIGSHSTKDTQQSARSNPRHKLEHARKGANVQQQCSDLGIVRSPTRSPAREISHRRGCEDTDSLGGDCEDVGLERKRSEQFVRDFFGKAETTNAAANANTSDASASGIASDILDIVDEFGGRAVTRSERERWVSVFRRLWYDGEIHRADLVHALKLSGYEEPDESTVHDAIADLTTFSTLSEIEFVHFICLYECKIQHKYRSEFQRFVKDGDGQGAVPIWALEQIFAGLGMDARKCVLDEVATELDTEGHGCISFEQFEQVVTIVRQRDGFLQRELNQFKTVFQSFDRSRSGEMSTRDLGHALEWLGFPITPEELHKLCVSEDVSGRGAFNQREFIRCLRHVQNTEFSKIARSLAERKKKDPDGKTSGFELVDMLQSLGYFSSPEAVLDAAKSSGLRVSYKSGKSYMFDDPQSFDGLCFAFGVVELSELLSSLRSNEGFTHAEMQELREVFASHKPPAHDYLTAREVSKALRWIGHPSKFDTVQHLISNIDVDGSRGGKLDFTMFLKLVRLVYDKHRKKAEEAFRRADKEKRGNIQGEELVAALKDMEWLDRNDESPPLTAQEKAGVNINGFKMMLRRFKRATLKTLRDNAGFKNLELAELEASFNKFQRDEPSRITKSELVLLIEFLVPSYAYSAKKRPHLTRILAEADSEGRGSLSFSEFVFFMRKVYDEEDKELLNQERGTIDELGYSHQEVKSFRELFLTADEDNFGKLSLEQVRQMFLRSGILGPKTYDKLERLFEQAVMHRKEGSDAVFDASRDCATFCAFMRLNRLVIDDRKTLGVKDDFAMCAGG